MLRKTRMVLCCLLVVVFAISMSACGKTDEPSQKPADTSSSTTKQTQTSEPVKQTGDEKFKIGWSVHFWNAFNSGLDDYIQKAFGKMDNVELITICAEGDALKQVADIEDMIAQGIDLLIVKAQDETTISNVLGEAREKGIIVMLLQREMQTENYDFFVGANMVNVGRDMGKAVLDAFPEGNFNYVFLEAGAGSSTDLQTVAGVAEVFKESGLPGITKLDGQNSQASRVDGKNITENWITAYGEEIDVLLACNDELLIGAYQAIQESDIKKKIFLGGCNAVAELLPAVKAGDVGVTFALAPGVFPGIEIAMEALQGNGDKYQKWYEIPCTPITPKNVGEYYDKVIESDLYMLGLLPPSENPLYENIEQMYPELVPLLNMLD